MPKNRFRSQLGRLFAAAMAAMPIPSPSALRDARPKHGGRRWRGKIRPAHKPRAVPKRYRLKPWRHLKVGWEWRPGWTKVPRENAKAKR